MYETDNKARASDEELIDVLTAISVVSKRLAKKLAVLSQTEGEEENERDERNGYHGTSASQCCRFD